MNAACTYCNSLKKAIQNQNYCSKLGDSSGSVSSNAYLFKSNKLFSGDHISRFSVRTVSNGYQKYSIGMKQYELNPNNYLIIPEGVAFQSEIKTNKPVEGLVVAFNSNDQKLYEHFRLSNEKELIDSPFRNEMSEGEEPMVFNLTNRVKNLFDQLKTRILLESGTKLFYQSTFLEILSEINRDKVKLGEKISGIPAIKLGTKREIYRRLKLAREYLDAYYCYDISLEELSKVSTMSPFHLLRRFKDFYGCTPQVYQRRKRMIKAVFLLKDSNKPINRISREIGFTNPSAFSRSFKKMVLNSPQAFRNS